MATLRILALHGYNGSAAVLQHQISTLAEAAAATATFTFIDAPSRAHGDFGWWHAKETLRGGKRYEGWERSRDHIIKICRDQGPFDGIFGFSQGAALAGLLVGLRKLPDDPNENAALDFRFSIHCGGFVSSDNSHTGIMSSDARFSLPSLHIIGARDSIVPPFLSFDLANCFHNPIIVDHPDGHVIPRSPDPIAAILGFLHNQQR